MDLNEKRTWEVANLSNHDQSPWLDDFRERGYDVDPAPREIKRAMNDSEDTLIDRIRNSLDALKREGFDAILISGYNHIIPYQYYIANELGIKTIVARFYHNMSGDKDLVDIYVLKPPAEISDTM